MITKRHLGWLFIALGLLLMGGLLAYDILKHHAVGERLQLVALGGALLIGLIGATLIPLGDTPV